MPDLLGPQVMETRMGRRLRNRTAGHRYAILTTAALAMMVVAGCGAAVQDVPGTEAAVEPTVAEEPTAATVEPTGPAEEPSDG